MTKGLFDGVNDYVTIPTMSPSHITISAWVKSRIPEASLTNQEVIANVSDHWSLRWRHNSGGPAIIVRVSSAYHSAQYNTNLKPDVWYHLTGTYDGETVIMYLDGVKVAENTTPSGNLDTVSGNVLIGIHSNLGVNFFNGKIDDVRVYNRALSSDEIKRLYNMGR